MLRLVLDTNVVLDLLHFADRAAAPLAHVLAAGRAHCLADALTLEEWRRVLGYPAFALDFPAARALAARYQAMVTLVDEGDAPPLPRCADPDDQKFLELAARAGAHLLVSKDKALLRLKGRQGLSFAIASPLAASEWLARV